MKWKEKISLNFFLLLFFLLSCSNRGQDTAIILYNKGDKLLREGEYYEALSYFKSSFRISRLSNFKKGVVLNLNKIGEVYYHLGKYNDALLYFKKAKKEAEKFNLNRIISKVIYNIGLVYLAFGNYSEACEYFNHSLSLSKKFKLKYLTIKSLYGLGLMNYEIGNYKCAELNFRKALNFSKKFNLSQYIADSLNYLGYIYLSQKDIKKAENIFINLETLNPHNKSLGIVEVLLNKNQIKKAIQILKTKNPKRYDSDRYRAYFFTLYGLILKKSGNLKKASKAFLKAVSLSEEIRGRRKFEKRIEFMKSGFYGGYIRAYKELIDTLSNRVLNGEKRDKVFQPYGKNLASAAFYFSEMTKARTFLEALAKSIKGFNYKDIDPNLIKKEKEILNKLVVIENLKEASLKIGEKAFLKLEKRKSELKRSLEMLILELRNKYPRYAILKYPKPFPPEDLPLKENEVLLEYAICNKATYIFLLRKGEVERIYKINITQEELRNKINKFMDPLLNNRSWDFSYKLSHELYELLIAKAVKEILPKEKIIIVPDGILGLLPFEALLVKEGRNLADNLYLGDIYQITYYQSATILTLNRLLNPFHTERPLFVLGNPIFNPKDPRYITYKKQDKSRKLLADSLEQYAFRGFATRRIWGKESINCEKKHLDNAEKYIVKFYPLPETEEEVKKIAKIFDVKPNFPDVLTGILASETNLKKIPLWEYRYLHFATHAALGLKLQGINEPFLLLGQVENAEGDDGFLTLSEVLELKLDADLVVLSACLTGRGKVIEGEGVVNFARAFQQAGARSVVVSLWEVASKPAVEFMEIFYKHLKEGKGKAEALRLTKKVMKTKYPNPYYWAVFILHGES